MILLAQAAGEAGTPSVLAESILFWVFAVVGVGSAIAVITMRNIVHAAMMLVVNFLAIAALYLALQSSFLSIIQIIVYAGAIMVLFLFVIMLLGVDRDDALIEKGTLQRVGGAVLAVAVAAALLFGVGNLLGPDARCGGQAEGGARLCAGLETALAADENGSVGVVADRLFTRYTFPFEAAGVLLTVATIGALMVGRRRDVALEDEPAYAPSAAQPGLDDLRALGDEGDDDRDEPRATVPYDDEERG